MLEPARLPEERTLENVAAEHTSPEALRRELAGLLRDALGREFQKVLSSE